MRRHLTWAGYGAVALAVLGCAPKPQPKFDLAAHQANQRRAARQRVLDRLNAPAPTGPVIEADGRRFQVWQAAAKDSHGIRYGNPYGGMGVHGIINVGHKGDHFQELRDADTGTVLVELEYVEFLHIPGRGLFMRDVNNRASEATHGGKTFWTRFSENFKRPWEFHLNPWQRLDTATGQFVATDILFIETYQGDAIDGRTERYALYRRKPAVNLRGRIDLEMVAPGGQSLGVYEDVVIGPARNTTVSQIGQFAMLRTYKNDPAELQDYLLGSGKQLLSVPKERLAMLGNVIGRPALGTTDAEDLWTILQPDGSFATPPGVLGLRPIEEDWNVKTRQNALASTSPRQPHLWLIRYAMPGESGYDAKINPEPARRWGWGDRQFARVSGPIWPAVEVVGSPYFYGSTTDKWRRSFIAVQWADGRALCYPTSRQYGTDYSRTLDPFTTPMNPSAMPTIHDAARDMLAAYAAAERVHQRQQAEDNARRHQQMLADWDRYSREDNKIMMRSIAYGLGGDYLYRYAKRSGQPDEIENVAQTMALYDIAKAKELRDYAKTLREAAERAKREAAAWESQQFSRQQQSSGTYSGVSPIYTPSSYTGPSAHQQMQNYKHNLDIQIFGRPNPYGK